MLSVLTIERIKSLGVSHRTPLLALKAYADFVLDHLSGSDDLVYLVDHVLHCNAFALQARVQIESARDYMQIAIDLLLNVLGFKGGRNCLDAGIDGNIEPILKQREFLQRTRVEILALLYITFNNWACCEVCSGNIMVAYSLFDLCVAFHEEMRHNMTLLTNTNLELVAINNESVHQITLCNFPEAEKLVARVLGRASHAQTLPRPDPLNAFGVQNALAKADSNEIKLLKGLLCHDMAITQEFQHCEEAKKWYAIAIQILESVTAEISKFDDLSQALRCIVSLEEKLSIYINETKQKMLEVLESKTENASRKRRKAASASRTGLKRTKRVATQVDKSSIIVSAPAINAELRSFIRYFGLPTMIVEVSPLKSLFDVLYPNPGSGTSPCASSFVSPLCEYTQSERSVVGVLVCTESPVQRAIEIQRMSLLGIRRPNSVWVLRPQVHNPPARRQPTEVSIKPMEIRNSKIVPQVNSTPPLSLNAIEKSHKDLGTLLKLLDKRLVMLLRFEKGFEDCWVATEMVKKALMAFYVPQKLLRLKADFIFNEKIQALREERSARILIAFFKRVLRGKQEDHSRAGQEGDRKTDRKGAVIVLQSYARRWLAIQMRKKLEFQTARMISLITRIQSWFRGVKIRMMFPELLEKTRIEDLISRKSAALHFAACEIQRIYRGHSTRLSVWRYLGQHQRATLHHLHDSRRYYATVIQSRVRGMLVRKKYANVVYAKKCSGKNKYWKALFTQSCIVIQRHFRGYLARSRLIADSLSSSDRRQRNNAATRLTRQRGGKKKEEPQRSVEAFVIVIQCSWRLYRAKRLFKELIEQRRIQALTRQKEKYKPFSIDEWIF